MDSFRDQSKEVDDKPTSPGGEEAQQEPGQEAIEDLLKRKEALEKKNEDLDKKMAMKRKEIEDLYALLAADAKRNFEPLVENFLILFIENLCWRRGIDIPDTACNGLKCQKAKYVALASMIKSENWEADYGIPIWYHNAVLAFPEYMSAKQSNIQRTEAEFASVLVSFHKGTLEYAYWGPLFRFCFGETVEEIASRFGVVPSIEELLDEEEDVVR